MKTIVVWYNTNNDTYYYRCVCNIIPKYEVGFVNSYKHVVVLTIDLYKDIIYKTPLKTRVIRRLIAFLHKLEK